MDHPTSMVTAKCTTMPTQSAIKYRKQVILMLGTVVLAFFVCLLPFRALTLWIIIAPAGSTMTIGFEKYYNILYFSRIMFHINSAVNPILYNIMSSKFRGGFLKLCGLRNIRKHYKKKTEITRKSTTSSSTNTSSQQTSETFFNSINKRHQSRYSNSLKEVKESSFEEEFPASRNNNATTTAIKQVYVRVPLHIINCINGQKLPNGEIYV